MKPLHSRDAESLLVVTSPDAWLGLPANRVRAIERAAVFDDPTLLDLARVFGLPSPERETSRVLTILGERQSFGVVVGGALELRQVPVHDRLVLPLALSRQSLFSHVTLEGGVPKVLIFDLAKLERLAAEHACIVCDRPGSSPAPVTVWEK